MLRPFLGGEGFDLDAVYEVAPRVGCVEALGYSELYFFYHQVQLQVRRACYTETHAAEFNCEHLAGFDKMKHHVD